VSENGPDAESRRGDGRGRGTVDRGRTDDQSVTPAERVQRLRAENERLRREYQRSRRVEYDRTAAGLAVLGVVGVAAGAALPIVREVLLVLGGIGLFAAVLTRFLAPEQFVPLDVAEGLYDATAETRADLVAELELAGDPRYVPTTEGVRLFVPRRDGASLPEAEALRSTLVVPDDSRRGVAFSPAGETLFDEFRWTLDGSLGESPGAVAARLADGLTEGLELVERASVDVDAAGRRVSMRLSGVPFGSVDRFDHPVVSFVGVGLATGLDTTVSVADARLDEDDALVAYTWDAATDGDEADA
jgi:hypothetical protein